MSNIKFYFQNYLFDLTFFIFFFVWRIGKKAFVESCRYLLAELKPGKMKSKLVTFKNVPLFNCIRSIRRKIKKQSEEMFSVNIQTKNFDSFLQFIQTKSAFLSNNQFYKEIHRQARLQVYKRMPWRLLSRSWGYMNSLELPVWLREPTYRLYVWVFNCKINEAMVQDLRSYKNLSEFFRRLLKPELRPIHQKTCLTSPVDGTILYCGKVQRNMLEQVKGVTYSLQEFLGPFEASRFQLQTNYWVQNESNDGAVQGIGQEANEQSEDEEDTTKKAIVVNFSSGKNKDQKKEKEITKIETEEEKEEVIVLSRKKTSHVSGYDNSEVSSNFGKKAPRSRLLSKCYSTMNMQEESLSKPSASHSCFSHIDTDTSHLLENPVDNSLFYCVIYLAPGDYHRFHSPTDWDVQHRRHFPGELFSVKPSVAVWLKGLFNLNERVLYLGKWRYGFFSMTAVGATNVGSISVYIDKQLKTNTRQKINQGRFFDKSFVGGKYMRGNEDLMRSGVYMKKGKLFGEFNLGSTIVLLYEAPKGLSFRVKPGHSVKYGQPLVSV